MKNFTNLLEILILPLFVFGNFLWMSTCSNGKTNFDQPKPAWDSQKKCEQFIKDRSFYWCYGYYSGTIWIVEDIGKDNEYKYLAATNQHVLPYGTRKDADVRIACDLNNKIDTNQKDSEYDMRISWDEFEKVFPTVLSKKIKPFLYSDKLIKILTIQDDNSLPSYGTEQEKDVYSGIDLSLFVIDFDKFNKGIPKKIKKKLDNLKMYKQKHKCINKIVDVSDKRVLNCDKYQGGYGVDKLSKRFSGIYTWNFHCHKREKLRYYSHEKIVKCKKFHPYLYEINKPKNYYDLCGKFVQKENASIDWMPTGTSGSMVITDQLEVCGIYWGDSGDDKNKELHYPCFDVFDKKIHSYIIETINNFSE